MTKITKTAKGKAAKKATRKKAARKPKAAQAAQPDVPDAGGGAPSERPVEPQWVPDSPVTLHKVELADPRDLLPHPQNYRTHPDDQRDHIRASLREHGFYRNVVVASDGTILAGHGVVEVAIEEKMESVPVIRLDISSDSPEAVRVLISDNYASHLARDDDRSLSELLKGLADGGGADALLGTGFDEMMIANFVMVTRHANEIESFDAAAEWSGAGMPEHDPGRDEIKGSIRFSSEEARENLLKMLGLVGEDAEGYVDRRGGHVSFWWPPRKKNDLASVKVVGNESKGQAETSLDIKDDDAE